MVLVLNAFRHHRKTHFPNTPAATTADTQVLNAFRHHRKTHSERIKGTVKWFSAQRLSASSEDSQLKLTLRKATERECSTPFGIIGRLTLLPGHATWPGES